METENVLVFCPPLNLCWPLMMTFYFHKCSQLFFDILFLNSAKYSMISSPYGCVGSLILFNKLECYSPISRLHTPFLHIVVQKFMLVLASHSYITRGRRCIYVKFLGICLLTGVLCLSDFHLY